MESVATTERLRVQVTNPATRGEVSLTLQGTSIQTPSTGATVISEVYSRRSTEYTILGTGQIVGSTKSTSKGYYLRASYDVLVQAFNPQGDGCGSMMVIPKDALGSDYYILSTKPVAAGTEK